MSLSAWGLALLGVAGLAQGCGDEPASRCGARTGVVLRVLDGDTIELESGVIVRYLLVDAPEIAHSASEVAECFGDEAKQANSQLVIGAKVELEYDVACEDRFGRTLAHVSVGDRMVNRTLIERGYARVLVIPPNDRYAEEFEALEAAAESRNAGLWGACP